MCYKIHFLIKPSKKHRYKQQLLLFFRWRCNVLIIYWKSKWKFLLQRVYIPATVKGAFYFLDILILLASVCRVLSRGVGLLGSTDDKMGRKRKQCTSTMVKWVCLMASTLWSNVEIIANKKINSVYIFCLSVYIFFKKRGMHTFS